MGLYAITTRAAGTVLTGFNSVSNIFNVDHLNHVTHTEPTSINAWEDTLAHMQATTAPAPAGVVSLPVALSDELQRLRFVIAEIKQKIAGAATPPFWYQATAGFTNAVMLVPTACRLEEAAAQNVPSGAETTVQFDTKIYDTASMASTPFIVCQATGDYICGGTLGFGDGATTGPTGDFWIQLNLARGATIFKLASQHRYSGSGVPKAASVETVKRFIQGDLLFLTVFQNSGSTQSPTNSLTLGRPALWMSMVARG